MHISFTGDCVLARFSLSDRVWKKTSVKEEKAEKPQAQAQTSQNARMLARLFIASLLFASTDAFAPSARAVKPVAGGVRSPAISMRGWEDPYAKGAGFKTDKLNVKKNSFDEEMDEINSKNNQVLGIALFAMIGIIIALVGTTSIQAGVL